MRRHALLLSSILAASALAPLSSASAQRAATRPAAPGARPAIYVESNVEMGPLTRLEAEAGFGRVRERLAACIGARDPQRRELSARMVIATNGHPVSVATQREQVASPTERGCLERTLMRARFEPRPRPSRIVVRLATGADPRRALLSMLASDDRSITQDILAGTGRLGGAEGRGGLGLRGTGRGGGGPALGPSGATRPRPTPRIGQGEVVVRGALPRGEIQRVIRRRLSAVRYCYERQLVNEPTLAGRVVVRFVIGPTGAVQTTQIAESSLSSVPVESCVARQIRRLRFPPPAGGGIVAVNYPFVFRTQGDGVPDSGGR